MTVAEHQTSTTTARVGWPETKRKTAAGTQTISVPIAGMSDATAVAAPKKIGSGMPDIQYPSPAKTPCARPVTIVPASVARPARRKTSRTSLVCFDCSGDTFTTLATSLGQERSTIYIVSSAKNRPSSALKVCVATAAAVAADFVARSPALSSRRDVMLDMSTPYRVSQAVAAFAEAASAPP